MTQLTAHRLCVGLLPLVLIVFLVGCAGAQNDARDGGDVASDDDAGPAGIRASETPEIPLGVFDGPKGWPIDAVFMDNGYLAVLYAASPMDELRVNAVALFDASLNFVSMIEPGLDFAHTLDTQGDLLLISDSGNARLVLLNPFTQDSWEISFEGWESHVWPNDADFTADGNIIFSDLYEGRVIKVTLDGEVLWSRSMLAPFDLEHEGMAAELHDPDELPNGNVLFCLSVIGTVYEIDPDDNVVWSYGDKLNYPKSVQRLANGNTLIGTLDQVLEVTPGGTVVWKFELFEGAGMNTERRADGNTLMGTTHVRLVAPDGTTLWEIEPEGAFKSVAADDPHHRDMLVLRSIGYL